MDKSPKEILETVLKVKVQEDTEYDDIPEWDSLAQLNLIAALEKEYKLRIPPEDVLKLTTLRRVEKYVCSKQEKTRGTRRKYKKTHYRMR